jgi:hypothetical protein
MDQRSQVPVLCFAFTRELSKPSSQAGNLSLEWRRVERALDPATAAGLCQVVQAIEGSATSSRVFDVLQDPQYSDRIAVLHLGRLDAGGGIPFESPEKISRLFAIFGLPIPIGHLKNLNLVFLSRCATIREADDLLRLGVPAVIVTSRALLDEAAAELAGSFYEGLARNASLRQAFDEATAKVMGNIPAPSGIDDSARGSGDPPWPWSLHLSQRATAQVERWSLSIAAGLGSAGQPTPEPSPRPNAEGARSVAIGSIFRQLEVPSAPSLDKLFGLAAAIQKSRPRAAKSFVSRTAMLFSALLLHPQLLELLQECGFNFSAFKQRVGATARILSLAQQELTLDADHFRVVPALAEPIGRYAQEFPGRPIDALGLIFGILSAPTDGLLEVRLEQSGLHREAASHLLADHIRQSTGVVTVREHPVAVPATGPLRPPFDGDGLRDRDLLGIGPSVRAFASLFASRELVPPLSVGLFGDWGSGKSFFMRQLRERVEKVSATARALCQAGRPTVLLGDIVQIEFNAWHYAEVNLWASLVTHIFDTLNRHFSPQEDLQQRWEALLRRLDEATRLQGDAQGMLRQAEEDLAATRARLNDRRLDLADTIEALWQGLGEKDRADLEAIEAAIGGEEIAEVRDSLVRLGGEGERAARRLSVFRQAAWRGLSSLALFKSYALVVLGVAAGSALLLLASSRFATLADTVRTLVASAAPIVTVLGGAAAWLASALRQGSKMAASLQRVEASVRRKLRDSDEGRQVRRAERAVEAACDEVEERRRTVAEVRVQIKTLRPSRWLSDFLRERASSSDYNKYLGITAIVRRDFEKLHQLMTQEPLCLDIDAAAVAVKDVNGRAELDLGALAAALNAALRGRDLPLDAERCTVGPAGGDSWQILDLANARRIEVPRQGGGTRTCTVSYDGPRIDRIVLYIDDLDRCPPRRVIEVLEAVHLLLALPLFVVVVGVDVRWVTRSLQLQYHDLWQQSDGTPAATPRDYLEKIFQIPFWLRPLDSALTGRMLESLLRRTDGEAAAGAAATPPDGDVHPELGAAAEAHLVVPDRDSTAAGAGEERAEDAPAPLPRVQSAAGSDLAEPPAGPTPASIDGQVAVEGEDLDADATAARLILGANEIGLITSLAPLVSRSPRAIKRFVNTYRLIRAAVPAAELDTFLGRAAVPGRNRMTLLLLALSIGLPSLAEKMETKIATTAAASPAGDALRLPPGSPGDDRLVLGMELLATTPANSWTAADLRRELARVQQYSFASRRAGALPADGLDSPDQQRFTA